MDITITLDPDTERFVRDEAEKRGVAPEAIIAQAMERERKAARARELLRSWDEAGDEAEQRETFEAIANGRNEERQGYRQHYPAI